MSDRKEVSLGSTVGGYRIDSVIGRGGMSVVYLAEHLRLERKVALKLIAPDLAQDEKFRERFVRESRLAASLEHPNIVPIYDAAEVEGVLFLSMRYIPGGDLRALIQHEGHLDPERTISILSQAASALDAAHAEGLVHRDVKPGNILITPRKGPEDRDRVYLSDFGLTKRTTSDSGITATGQFVGTLDYAAPEQFEGRTLDGRADVYSLGCLLYECLTGEVPFPRENQAALVYAHLQAVPPKVTGTRPELPTGIDHVVAKAMAKSPGDRYQSAEELVQAAADALGVEPVASTTPVTPTRPLQIPPPRRRRAGLLVGIGAALVAVTVTLVLLLNGGGTPPSGGGTTAPPEALIDYVARINPATRAVTRIAVGKDPAGVTTGEGSAWVVNSGDDTVSRVDPASGTVTATIKVGKEPSAIAYGEGAVWVANKLERSVSRIDPATNHVVATILLEDGPVHIAAGAGAVWVGLHDSVLDIDPATNEVAAEIPHYTVAGGDGGAAVVGAGANGAWFGGDIGDLSRIDPATDRARLATRLGHAITGISVQGDSVWVVTLGIPGMVHDIDAGTGKAKQDISAGGGFNYIAEPRVASISAADAAVWVTDAVNGTASQIITVSGQVQPPIDVGKAPTGIAVGLGSIWVTVNGSPTP